MYLNKLFNVVDVTVGVYLNVSENLLRMLSNGFVWFNLSLNTPHWACRRVIYNNKAAQPLNTHFKWN